MEAYKYPDWLTKSGNLRAGAEATPKTIAALASEVETLVAHNNKLYRQRLADYEQILSLASKCYDAQHEMRRKLHRTPPEMPLDLRAMFGKLRGKIEALQARRDKYQKAREARIRRDAQERERQAAIPDSDWPAK